MCSMSLFLEQRKCVLFYETRIACVGLLRQSTNAVSLPSKIDQLSDDDNDPDRDVDHDHADLDGDHEADSLRHKASNGVRNSSATDDLGDSHRYPLTGCCLT